MAKESPSMMAGLENSCPDSMERTEYCGGRSPGWKKGTDGIFDVFEKLDQCLPGTKLLMH